LRLWLADKRVGNVKDNGPELLEQHVVENEQPALLEISKVSYPPQAEWRSVRSSTG
jgi:hypothetical protein